MRRALSCLLVMFGAARAAFAQVAIYPPTTTPATWERFAVRVVNQTDTPTVAVRVEVPQAVTIMGVDGGRMWPFRMTPGTDSTPQHIEWRGGPIRKGEFREFAFLGRLAADARQEDLVFPMRIERASGSVVEWRRGRGENYAAPRVEVLGTARLSPAGMLAMAGAAVGIAILALVVAIARGAPRRT
ncbi:MAG: DUF1775 domain-containing protein [Gemmatimonadetes bacterium]|nr:DUF1775 domain-containing protein [Gemmatimonadota bacterium]